jgi:hypothetical protein
MARMFPSICVRLTNLPLPLRPLLSALLQPM